MSIVKVTFKRIYPLFEWWNKLFFSFHVLLNYVLIWSLLSWQFIEFTLVLCMDNVIFFGERILSEGLNMVRPKIPFFLIRRIFSNNKALIIANRQQDWVFTLSFTIIDSRFVLEFYLVFVIVMTYSFTNVWVILFFSYYSLLLFDSIVNVGHEESGDSQRVVWFDFFDMRKVGKEHTGPHPYNLWLITSIILLPSLHFLIIPYVERICV